MSHQLLESLRKTDSVRAVVPETLQDFISGLRGRIGVLFLAGDPEKKLETADVAVVLRELLTIHESRLAVAMADPGDEVALMKACHVTALPSLVFFADGEQRAILPKIQDWSVYDEKLRELTDQFQTEPTP